MPSVQWTFFDAKADLMALLPADVTFAAGEHPLLHPGRSAQIAQAGGDHRLARRTASQALAKFELSSAPVVFELDVAALQQCPMPVHVPVSKQPLVRRDMALVVANSVNSDALTASLREAAPAFVRAVEVFDVPRRRSARRQKALQFGYLCKIPERTLADNEIEGACQRMLDNVQQQHGAALRA